MATTDHKFVVKNGLAVGSSIDVINSSGQWVGATGTLSGATGPTGASGSQGINGASGFVGSNGATGVDGASGIQGASGITGASGIQGASGTIGVDGATGSIGLTGATGILTAWTLVTTTTTLAKNAQYIIDTTSGSFTVTLPASPSLGDQVIVQDGGNFSTNNLTIARNGSTIEGQADNILADIGGVLMTLIYDGSTWQISINTGAAGASGPSGASGINGASGTIGVDGASGANGATGISGSTGPTGATGLQGASGSTGLTGATGVSGSTGANLIAGASGAIFENVTTIGANYTLTSGRNGMSVGPITVDSGVSVTVPSGARWVVL